MSRQKIKDVGLREHRATIATQDDEIFEAARTWIADLSGQTPGQAARRDTANRYTAILSEAEMGDLSGASLDVSRLLAAGHSEASPVWIAALWLRELAAHDEAQRTGNTDLAIDTAETLGRLQERMWWRASHEPTTGKTPESLALSGRKQTKAGQNGSAMKSSQSFAARYGDRAQNRADELAVNGKLNWSAIKQRLASEFGVSVETIKRTVLNPKK